MPALDQRVRLAAFDLAYTSVLKRTIKTLGIGMPSICCGLRSSSKTGA
jgi:hypothetical protein